MKAEYAKLLASWVVKTKSAWVIDDLLGIDYSEYLRSTPEDEIAKALQGSKQLSESWALYAAIHSGMSIVDAKVCLAQLGLRSLQDLRDALNEGVTTFGISRETVRAFCRRYAEDMSKPLIPFWPGPVEWPSLWEHLNDA